MRLLARCAIEIDDSIENMDLRRLFRAQNLHSIIIDKTPRETTHDDDDEKGWLLERFENTPTLADSEYNDLERALKGLGPPPHVLGIMENRPSKILKTQFEKDCWLVQQKRNDRKVMIGAKRKYDFCRDYPGMNPETRQKLYDWLFATKVGRSSVYFTLQAIGKIRHGVAEIIGELPDQHRLFELHTRRQEQARLNQECAKTLKRLGVCVLDKAPHMAGGLKSFMSPGVDCTKLIAVSGIEDKKLRPTLQRAGLTLKGHKQTRLRPRGPGQGGWQAFLKQYKREHPDLAPKEATKQAGLLWPKGKRPKRVQKTTYRVAVDDNSGDEGTPSIEELGLILNTAQ